MLTRVLIQRLACRPLRLILRLLYRVEATGMEHYYTAGSRVIIIANHSSLLDGLLLYAWLPEIPTFVVNANIKKQPDFRFFLQFVKLFRIRPGEPLALKSVIKFVKKNHKIVIFPEGRITTTDSLMKIYSGPAIIADHANATVLPIAIDGAQFSPYSYQKNKRLIKWFPKIKIRILPPQQLTTDPNLTGLRRREKLVLQLEDIMHALPYHSFNYDTTIFSALIHAANRYGANTNIIEDSNNPALNYRTTFTKALILAQQIRHTEKTGQYVGFMLPNTTSAVILFIALQAIGQIPAMLNFTMGNNVLLEICRKANIRTLYTAKIFIKKAQLEPLLAVLAQEIKIIYLEDIVKKLTPWNKLAGLFWRHLPSYYHRRHCASIDPNKTALILFTSGSQATPKGVALSHRNILANYAQISSHIDFKPTDIIFNCLPLFHCFGLNAGLLVPILGGSKVFLYPSPLHYRLIPELIYELQATILLGSNTFFQGYGHYADPFDFHSLRYAIAGAEKLRHETQQLWMEKFGIRILQGYGTTETSPILAINTPIKNKMKTVGRLIPGITYTLQPVENLKEGGRLFVSGPNIMLGYLSMTGDDKIHPPKSEQFGEGWYDTGDIVNIDDDGFLTILGRAKRFAKIGGEMVSLTAVEDLALAVWPTFDHAAIVQSDPKKGEQILLATNCNNIKKEQLLKYAKKHQLTQLTVPQRIIIYKSLPTLSTGKLDYPAINKMMQD